MILTKSRDPHKVCGPQTNDLVLQTAPRRHPEWGYGYTAALINFRFLAHAVMTTDEVVDGMERGKD